MPATQTTPLMTNNTPDPEHTVGFYTAQLADRITEYQFSAPHPDKDQEFTKFTQSLIQLKRLILKDIDDQRSYVAERDILNSSTLLLAKETISLMEKLISPKETDPLKILTDYVDAAQKIIPPTSKGLNFLKAIGTIAIAAINMILLPAIITVVGPLVFPILGMMAGKTMGRNISERHKTLTQTLGVFTGLMLSPLIYLAAVAMSPIYGARKGYFSGKKATGIPAIDSPARFLLFKPPVLISALHNVEKTGTNCLTNKKN